MYLYADEHWIVSIVGSYEDAVVNVVYMLYPSITIRYKFSFFI